MKTDTTEPNDTKRQAKPITKWLRKNTPVYRVCLTMIDADTGRTQAPIIFYAMDVNGMMAHLNRTVIAVRYEPVSSNK